MLDHLVVYVSWCMQYLLASLLSDFVICKQIVCQSSTDDDDMAEQQDDDQVEEDVIDDLQQEDADRTHGFSRAYNGQKREPVARREQLKNTVNRDEIHREDDMHVVLEASGKYRPDKEIGLPYEERYINNFTLS